jgi:GNAT superfamily N-acetyltransferase
MTHEILLVHPPMTTPGLCDPAPLRGLQALQSMGRRAGLFDAGRDFYNRFVLDENQLDSTLRLLNSRISSGAFEPADAQTRDLVRQMGSGGPGRRSLLEDLRAAHDGLQSDLSADPQSAAACFHHLDRLLALVSAAYQPCGLSRCGFHHPGLNLLSDVKDFIDDTLLNPFVQYGLGTSGMPEGARLPELVICLVTRAGQVAPAASLLATWARRWPQIYFGALGDPSWVQAVHDAAGLSRPDGAAPDGMKFWEAWHKIAGQEAEGRPATAPAADDVLPQPPAPPPNLAAHPLHADGMARHLPAPGRPLDQTIVWEDPQGELKAITGHLYTAARAGAWNHLVLPDDPERPLVKGLITFAGANPNIVHSWCLRGQPSGRFADSAQRWPRGSARYGETASLPGRPLWQVLQDPLWLAAFRQRLGAKTLMQLRMDPADDRVYEIGRRLAYHFTNPDQLPEGYLDEICRMVEAGGSVGTRWLRHNLERAFLIAWVEEHGVIVGNSSLKHPRQEYIEAVSAQSGLDLHNYLERGYTSVRPEYRGLGIGARLLEGLTERAAGHMIFSIIGEDNIATQKMAIRNRTRKVAAFMSTKAGKPVGVWIPEWMLPEGIILPPQPAVDAPRSPNSHRKDP